MCNAACPQHPHVVPSCVNGVCESACVAGYADCNGDVNDGCEQNVLQDEPCACIPGSVQSCYLGAPGTENVGPCKAGVKTCDPTGLSWGVHRGGASAGSTCNPVTGGWYYDDLINPTKIVLCPATCDKIIAGMNGMVKIQVGCGTVHQ